MRLKFSSGPIIGSRIMMRMMRLLINFALFVLFISVFYRLTDVFDRLTDIFFFFLLLIFIVGELKRSKLVLNGGSRRVRR